jgi:hypothetical protein
VAGRIANMTGISLVPDVLWREAERRAAVIRPLAARLADLVCDRPLTSTSKIDRPRASAARLARRPGAAWALLMG